MKKVKKAKVATGVERVRIYRKVMVRYMGLKEAAKRLGCSPQHLSYGLRGTHMISKRLLSQIEVVDA